MSLVGRSDLTGEIYRQIRRAVIDGRLRPGDQLPPSRELARRVRVSRTTVMAAYDRLHGEGFVTSRQGAGTYVAEHVPARGAPTVRGPGPLRAQPRWDDIALPTAFDGPAAYDLRSGLPDTRRFPYGTWRRLLADETRTGAVGGGPYGDPAGHQPLRAAIARHIGTSRDVTATADHIVITSGTQQALDLVTRVLLCPGDRVAVEDPGYEPLRRLFESHGLVVGGVPVDGDGLIVDEIPAGTRLVCVTPSHQYPLGSPMTLPRRVALLGWARRHDAAIVEDDYDTEFRYGGRPLEPLQTLDVDGRVIYVGSFSKTMLPTLRLGYASPPPGCDTPCGPPST